MAITGSQFFLYTTIGISLLGFFLAVCLIFLNRSIKKDEEKKNKSKC